MCKHAKGKRKMHHCISKVHMRCQNSRNDHEKANKTRAIFHKKQENHTNRTFNFLKHLCLMYEEEARHDYG